MSLGEAIIFGVLALSLWAYVVCGGADFGVGILELFARGEARATLRKEGERAIAPVWEANHIWIIIALVILFVGYPDIHTQVATSFHIPVLAMLVGILLRGTAFTFRYYDGADDPTTRRLWSTLFRGGSVLVPLVFGHLAAAMARGHIPPEPASVWESYMAPWLGLFPLAVGLFTTALFAWLAAVFLAGEATEARQLQAAQRALRSTGALLFTGLIVSVAAWHEGVPWFVRDPFHPLRVGGFLLATLAIGRIVWQLNQARRDARAPHGANPLPFATPLRLAAGLVVVGVLLGYWGAAFPIAVELKGQNPLTWTGAAAPESTTNALALALSIAAAVILPSLSGLYWLFKQRDAT